MARSARRRRPRRQPPRHVTDVPALRGPDGTLNGDVRALLLAAPRDDRFEERQTRLRKYLLNFQQEHGQADCCALAMALYPWVRRLFGHRIEEATRATARAAAKQEPLLSPDQAIVYLDALIAHYRYVEAIWEPLEKARAALDAFRKHPKPRPWWPSSTKRWPRRGNPTARLARDARKVLLPYLDEDETTEILRLVGLLPLP